MIEDSRVISAHSDKPFGMNGQEPGRDLVRRDNLLPEHNADQRGIVHESQVYLPRRSRPTEPLFVIGFYLLAPLNLAIWKEKVFLRETPQTETPQCRNPEKTEPLGRATYT